MKPVLFAKVWSCFGIKPGNMHISIIPIAPNFIYRYKDIYGYYVYTSTYHMVDCNYGDIEGVGVQPDIEVKFNRSALMTGGKDSQLNSAVDYLRKVCIWNQTE